MNNFSMAAFVKYGNSVINNAQNKPENEEISKGFKADLKRAIAHAGYPSKDEIGVIDTINDFDMSNTLEAIPTIVSGYMKNEDRAFNIPATDDKCTSAKITIVSKEEETKTGENRFTGGTYTTTIAAHDEYKVSNNRDPFKSKK